MSIIKRASRDQIVEVVRQLGNGEMDGDYTQAVIEHRFVPWGVSAREVQARRLYDLRFGDVLGCSTFEMYRDGTDAIEAVPQIPNFSKAQVRLFGREGICLVDGRVAEKVGIKEYCKLLGLIYTSENDTFEPHDPKRVKSGVRWMIGQDGYRNRGRGASDCRNLFQPFEIGMDWIEGPAVYAQNPKVIEAHYLDLPGSVRRRDRGDCAYLGVFGDGPGLHWRWDGSSDPRCGSASRGE